MNTRSHSEEDSTTYIVRTKKAFTSYKRHRETMQINNQLLVFTATIAMVND